MGEITTQKALEYMTEKFQALIKEFDSFKSLKESIPKEFLRFKRQGEFSNYQK
jgi:hypothetical protein